ncbi:GNAT family N-acetyltransferase [Nonomuraea cavernae]|uniref:Lysine N-acyltransferase MbtK n=1 Tax=Nonomuraea cavernae TaxID=2045107 RepID=A0A918DG81_9ACTN|nr:GNAT family N-acetyltransferase [Nonomuraea cavernae]MCA2184170.1 acetyltransferase [Nonomuraea cavernae]GGO62522.1 acetyltransferase [Nonomuraea cavernae]
MSPEIPTPTSPARRAAVHEQVIDGFGTVRVVPLDPAADLDVIYPWVTQERARFWGMLDATRERVLELYEFVGTLDSHHAFLLHRDDRPVALFQSYDPEFDPVGECYEVRPGDYGIHLMIGPVAGEPEPGFTGALLTTFLTYVLADPSRRRIVAEPDARNDKAIARLVRTGFVPGPEIDLPGKRARLVFLSRETFEQPHRR